ncbi:hypothetical protein Hanom_Chr02g00096391 [Helianthus anomalus]
MNLTSWMKMARFQTYWIQMRKNKPLDESHKTSQTWHFTLKFNINIFKMLYILSYVINLLITITNKESKKFKTIFNIVLIL